MGQNASSQKAAVTGQDHGLGRRRQIGRHALQRRADRLRLSVGYLAGQDQRIVVREIATVRADRSSSSLCLSAMPHRLPVAAIGRIGVDRIDLISLSFPTLRTRTNQ